MRNPVKLGRADTGLGRRRRPYLLVSSRAASREALLPSGACQPAIQMADIFPLLRFFLFSRPLPFVTGFFPSRFSSKALIDGVLDKNLVLPSFYSVLGQLFFKEFTSFFNQDLFRGCDRWYSVELRGASFRPVSLFHFRLTSLLLILSSSLHPES